MENELSKCETCRDDTRFSCKVCGKKYTQDVYGRDISHSQEPKNPMEERLTKDLEKIIPQEMALGRENPFLKIMYDHAPNNAKFYEKNVDRINNFRVNFLSEVDTIINSLKEN